MNKLLLQKYLKYVSLYLSAGRSPDDAFSLSLSKLKDKKFKEPFAKFVEKIKDGASMDSALETLLAKGSIDSTVYALISLGYGSGNLKSHIDQASKYIEKSQSFRKKLAGALAYPAVVLSASLLSVLYIANFVLPKVVPIFDSLKAPVPFVTKALMGTMALVYGYGLQALTGIFCFASIVLLTYAKQREFRMVVEKYQYRIPFFGMAMALSHIQRVSLAIGTLLVSHIPVSEAFDVAMHSCGNSHLKDGLSAIKMHIEEGRPLSGLALHSYVLSSDACDSLALGEATGTMPQAFLDLSNLSAQEYEDALAAVTGVVEPAALVLSALLVGTVALSVISPMYSLVQHVN